MAIYKETCKIYLFFPKQYLLRKDNSVALSLGHVTYVTLSDL